MTPRRFPITLMIVLAILVILAGQTARASDYEIASKLRKQIRATHGLVVAESDRLGLTRPRKARLSWRLAQLFPERAHWRSVLLAYKGAQIAWSKRAKRLPHYAGLMCIHRHEGAWTDPGAPYWGGLQMDMNFQRAYGRAFLARWGTADHWPVWAQLVAASRAVASRGFSPWANTARSCGLL